MKYLRIKNDGMLDIRLVSLMGGTTKSLDQTKIGQFGSGLKYAMAYFFRNNIKFRICIGNEEIDLGLVTEHIQGEDFKIITVNKEKTSITTKMGLDWKPWMIIRELYSNALDEGGAEYSIVEDIEHESDTTQFYVELNTDFLQVYNNWDKYFVVNKMPMYENDKFAFYPSHSKLKLYKQGILIHEGQQMSFFDYDIKTADINELREYTGFLENDISKAIFSIDDKIVIAYILEQLANLANNKGEQRFFESDIDLLYWRTYDKMNTAWTDVLGDSKVIHPKAKAKLKAMNPNIDLDDTILVPENFYKALTTHFEGVGALRVASKMNEFYEVHDQDLEQKLKEAIVILEGARYFIHPELTYVFGEFGNKKTLAQINLDTKEIFISQRMKDMSMFKFCGMLVEENEHFQTGFSDETRAFQQHFIDLYVKAMFDKHEIKLL